MLVWLILIFFEMVIMKNILKLNMTYLLLLLLAFTSCKKDKDNDTAANAEVMTDVAYGPDASQKMDVYLPANRSDETGVIVLVHGGSFVSGDKSEINVAVEKLKDQGYAVVNINYRLVDGGGLSAAQPVHKESAVKIKDQVDDVAKAIAYIRDHDDEWVIDDDKIGLAGHSAGATLALLYAYDNRNDGHVKAVANWAGALDITFTDLPGWQFYPRVLFETGFRYTGYELNLENDSRYKAISPLYVANANRKVPTLNIFPENNRVGQMPKQDISVYNSFTARLNEIGVPNKFVQVGGADHVFSQPGNYDKVTSETLAYFNANIR